MLSYQNVGLNQWAIIMDRASYFNEPIQENDVGGRVAVIDSGNKSIQIPDTQFKNFQKKIMSQEASISQFEINGETILVSRRSCADLEHLLSDFTFTIQDFLFTIHPSGYLYSTDG